MFRGFSSKTLFFPALLAAVLGGSSILMWQADAQETKQPAATAEKAPSKPRGRLPNFYRFVVTPDQREKIYTIQQSYASRIEKLEQELAKLKSQQNKEVEAVLSEEQLERVKAMLEEAKLQRAARASAAEAEEAE